MKAVKSLSLLALSSVLVAGCVAETAPEDEASLDPGSEGELVSEAEPAETDPGTEEVGQSSDALCSCVTDLRCANGQLTVYENSSCCGGNFYFCPGNYPDLTKYTNNLGWLANWNDRISRINTSSSPKVGVYVYQHVNYGGDVRYFAPGSFVDLGPGLWNDKISSLKVVAIK